MDEKILTKHPHGKKGVNILKRRYDAIRDAILNSLSDSPTLTLDALVKDVGKRLKDFDGKVGWYVVTVKLDLEARGEIERVPKTSPHELKLTGKKSKTAGKTKKPAKKRTPAKKAAADANPDAVMKELESLGTAQNRKVYSRHGASEPMFGLSFANLRKLTKKYKGEHGLALTLWKSGNMDAQSLAALIADPEQMTASELDTWAREADYYPLSDLVSELASKTPFAEKKMHQWMKSKKEYVRRCGYGILCQFALNQDDGRHDDYYMPFLTLIEAEIHDSPNRAREKMNSAVICIGTRTKKLNKEAMKAAGRIGEVYVDHGETGCKTPDAASYLKHPRIQKKLK